MNRTFQSGSLGLLLFWICTSASELPAAGFSEKRPVDSWWAEPQPTRISLMLSPEAIESLRKDPRQNVSASIREGGTEYPDVRIHLKGSIGSFRPIDEKPGFTVSFAKSEARPLFHGNSKIHLNNSVEDPSYLNEKLGTIIFGKAGIPAAQLRHAVVELNGKALGMFILKEGFTREFLGRYFADASGTLYDRDSTGLQEDGVTDAAELAGLGELARVTDPDEQWTKATKLVDMEEFLSFMAIEVMLCHRDGFSLARNNYRLYHDPVRERLVFLPHGMDQLFGRPGFPWRPSMSGTIAQITMARPETQHAYRERLENLVTNFFDVPLLNKEVDRTAALIAPLLAREEKSSFAAAIPDLKSRIARRKAFLVYELGRPEPRPLAFIKGEASLTNWIAVDPPPGGQMAQKNSPDGRPSLYIQAGGLTAASWRAKVLLPRGAYRFEGTVRVKGVLPLAYGNHHGARLRIGGGKGENGIVGDQTWTQVSTDFTIAAESVEVELLCELRARGGEAWFDSRSLRLLLRNASVTNLKEGAK
jgi:hypothetical protein